MWCAYLGILAHANDSWVVHAAAKQWVGMQAHQCCSCRGVIRGVISNDGDGGVMLQGGHWIGF